MDKISILIKRVQTLAARKGQSLSTISRKLLNDGKGIARLQSGGQCTLRTLNSAFAILETLEVECAVKDRTARKSKLVNNGLSYLERLESESIHIFRETVAECAKSVLLYSAGKDSAVMLHLAMKAFYPSRLPFVLLHIDTGWKFKEMIAFRDRRIAQLGLKLHAHINLEGKSRAISPLIHGGDIHTDVMKTQGLKQALDKFGFDVAFGGARRDEEKSRAKERIFSIRSAEHKWDPKAQRAELWDVYNTRLSVGESLRVFPLSNWTELDIWQYIHQEKIEIPDLYFAKLRPVVERDGMLILVDDKRLLIEQGETVEEKMVRFRTLGCYPLTGATVSQAMTVPDIIEELLNTKQSERVGRTIDNNESASMERKKVEGYF